MTVTKNIVDVTQKIIDILTTNATSLGLKGIYYGETDLVPEFPSVEVASMRKVREIRETHRYNIDFMVGILIMHGKVQTVGVSFKAADVLAEAIEDILNANYTLDGIVDNGFIHRIDTGQSRRNDVMIKSTRIIWEGFSREVF